MKKKNHFSQQALCLVLITLLALLLQRVGDGKDHDPSYWIAASAIVQTIKNPPSNLPGGKAK